jgi:N6-L-threonylcarbamoyladenine synthase
MLPGSWDFSFSGLKTALLYYLQGKGRVPRKGNTITPPGTGRPPAGGAADGGELADIVASFQEAVMETLALKTLAAAASLGASRIVVGGGVAANSRLRRLLPSSRKIKVCFPPLSLCTDNAAMIAYAAALRLERDCMGKGPGVEPSCLVDPALPIRSWS